MLTNTLTVDLDTAEGRLVRDLLARIAQWRREETAEKTREALARLRKEGGGTPRLEGKAAARVLALSRSGLSLREVAAQLTKEKVPTLKGGDWAAETVRRVIARSKTPAA